MVFERVNGQVRDVTLLVRSQRSWNPPLLRASALEAPLKVSN